MASRQRGMKALAISNRHQHGVSGGVVTSNETYDIISVYAATRIAATRVSS